MNKILVLAEKPSVGKDIGRVLNCNKKGNGYLEGEKYVVTWALGHLVTLADPEAYEERYKSWRIEDLPMIPNKFKLVVIKETSKQFNIVKDLLNRKDVTSIVIATDAGREGELVARWILEKARVNKPLKRLWISSVTDKAIMDGFKNLKDAREYENLFASAIARSEADWLVGINSTRALTCKFNAQLSCGRVQTPTLFMVSKREEEIRAFKPKQFYGITAMAEKLKFFWIDGKTMDMRTFEKDKCQKILNGAKGKEAEIFSVEKTLKKSYAPKLYDLTELQRDANKIFDFSAKETLNIMQRLYESHKILTYPRTDSRYITTDVVDTLKDRIKACGVGPYSKAASKLLKMSITPSKSFVDNSKVSDHHAIIPTEQSVILSALNDRERKIYDLVVKRFLAVLYPPFEYEQTTIKARIGEETFIAKGKIVLKEGYKEVYGSVFEDEADDNGTSDHISEQILPEVKKGDKIKIKSLLETHGETKPPQPFNEATLLSAMENPTKYMSGEKQELLKTIEETGGLGTVATRADIIDKLFNTFLIEKKGKNIFITSKGKQLLELVPEGLKSPTLTAKWEQKLKFISKGTLSKDSFINEMIIYSKNSVNEIKNSSESFKHDNLTRIKCPVCGKYMLEVNGKKGKMLVCQDRDCGYRKGIARVTNARCPNCHKKLELVGEGEGQIFVCGCGFREKLSAFNERKKNESKNVSKREVQSYLQSQNKKADEPINNALAEALAKFKNNQ